MLQNCLVYAARYAHHRNTGAAMQVCMSIIYYYDQLDVDILNNLYNESFEAVYNRDDWNSMRNSLKEKGYVPTKVDQHIQ
jgi:hypothetical protein